jgi:hypothetical protein
MPRAANRRIQPSSGADGWLAELNAAAAKIPDRVHEELAAALEGLEAESKELGRREMEKADEFIGANER